MPERQDATVRQQGEFQQLQALEDAIAYRMARLTAPCPGCAHRTGDHRCDEHARDLELVNELVYPLGLVLALRVDATPAIRHKPTHQAGPGDGTATGSGAVCSAA